MATLRKQLKDIYDGGNKGRDTSERMVDGTKGGQDFAFDRFSPDQKAIYSRFNNVGAIQNRIEFLRRRQRVRRG